MRESDDERASEQERKEARASKRVSESDGMNLKVI